MIKIGFCFSLKFPDAGIKPAGTRMKMNGQALLMTITFSFRLLERYLFLAAAKCLRLFKHILSGRMKLAHYRPSGFFSRPRLLQCDYSDSCAAAFHMFIMSGGNSVIVLQMLPDHFS